LFARHATLVAVTVLASSTAAAQQAPALTPCTGAVDGHAVDASTHEPVAGATVTVDDGVVAITDEDGRFALDGLCPGSLTVTIERVDYAIGSTTIAVEGRSSIEVALQLAEGETIVIEDKAPDVEMRSATVVTGEALERTRGRGFSDTLAEVPGVSQLRSASGMAKPIVRGQYGRRLLILVDGVRHRSQEWGLDHAPEIDPFVAAKLTVVRGASGVRYGPDAIGGAVLVDPPELLRDPGYAAEAHLIGMSNGLGAAVAGRLQVAPDSIPGLAWRVEGSDKHLAAPSTPDYALDNTGSAEWNLGATGGYRVGDSSYRLSYSHYQARLGVCTCLRIESSDDFYAQLEREQPVGAELYTSDFEIERPSQSVGHDLAIGRGEWRVPNIGTLTATYSFQHDLRREYDIVRDATTGPQFQFRLMTHELDVELSHDPLHLSDHLHLRGAAGLTGMAQVHYYGGLPLVPDHKAAGAGVYAIERLVGHDFELEVGLRYDVLARSASIERQDFLRLVRSGQIGEDACSGSDPVECGSRFHMVSASLGGLRQLTDAWSIKLDLSTATRAPNPDEQYLNGTAPTFPVFGLGKPDLRPETTYAASATTTFQGDRLTAEASAYANLIDDYIYFAPAIDASGDPIFDVLIRGTFPRFVTRPVDAFFYGADGGIAATPVPWLELGAQVSIVRARNLTEDGYLVFVPPDRVRGSVTLKRAKLGQAHDLFASISGTFTAEQTHYDLAADFAPPPDAYFLLGAEAGAATSVHGNTVKLALQGTNLLDQRYRDYTSLLRYFADQPGWQVLLRLSVELSSSDH